VRTRLTELKAAFAAVDTTTFFISAATGEGVNDLMTETVRLLRDASTGEKADIRIPKKVFRPQPRSAGPSVHKEGDTFVVVAPGLERMMGRMDISSYQVHQQLKRQLTRLGVSKSLEKAGIKRGDRVRCGDLEWEW
jgi:Obg family GTPase CgtA-like protein